MAAGHEHRSSEIQFVRPPRCPRVHRGSIYAANANTLDHRHYGHYRKWRTSVMSHPSGILRGKVLTLPLLNVSEGSAAVEAVAAAAMRRARARAHFHAHVLVTLSDGDGSLPRVLTVSGPRQRTLSQWNAILAPDLIAAGVTADWGKALVLIATSGSARDS